jgi:hypothetical protein
MASTPKKPDARKVAESESKGWRVKARSSIADKSEAIAAPDATMPPLSDLRSKYIGDSVPIQSDGPLDTGGEDTEVVTLESGSQSKIVGVRGGKVRWRQG